MIRRRRIRRVLKWCGLVLSLVVITAWAISLRWSFVYFYVQRPYQTGDPLPPMYGGVQASGQGWYWGRRCCLEGGQLIVWSRSHSISLELGQFDIARRVVSAQWDLAWNAGKSHLIVPLWIPFLLVAIPTALLFWRDRRRIPPGHCQRCGYDLTGNISGTCPECGVKTGGPT